MRDLIRIVENGSGVVDSETLARSVRLQHHTPQDLYDGNLLHRIFRYNTYRIQQIPLVDLDLDEWLSDDTLVDDYARRQSKAPPIIYDPIAKSIIDGTHRAKAALLLGLDYIDAYVGDELDPEWNDIED